MTPIYETTTLCFDRAWIIRGEPTSQRFKGKGKRDGWQYPSSLMWKKSLFVAYSVNKEDVSITRIELDSFGFIRGMMAFIR